MAETKAPTESQLAKQRARNAQLWARGGGESSFWPQRFPELLGDLLLLLPSPLLLLAFPFRLSYFAFSSFLSRLSSPGTKRVAGNPPGSLVLFTLTGLGDCLLRDSSVHYSRPGSCIFSTFLRPMEFPLTPAEKPTRRSREGGCGRWKWKRAIHDDVDRSSFRRYRIVNVDENVTIFWCCRTNGGREACTRLRGLTDWPKEEQVVAPARAYPLIFIINNNDDLTQFAWEGSS